MVLSVKKNIKIPEGKGHGRARRIAARECILAKILKKPLWKKVRKTKKYQTGFSQTAQRAFWPARFSWISGCMSNFYMIFFEVVSSNVSFIFLKYFAAKKRHHRELSTANTTEKNNETNRIFYWCFDVKNGTDPPPEI